MSRTASSILSAEGPIATHLGAHFESRPEQGLMAEGVARAMETRTHLLVEAGTGVGKSFAYLVPAILRCIERNEKIVIATNTISLQEQLIEKDIPLLSALLTPPTPPGGVPALRPVLVKGRQLRQHPPLETRLATPRPPLRRRHRPPFPPRH